MVRLGPFPPVICLISLDQKLSGNCPLLINFFHPVWWGRGGGPWDYPSASETFFVHMGMDKAPAARKPECAVSQKGSGWHVRQPWQQAPSIPAAL